MLHISAESYKKPKQLFLRDSRMSKMQPWDSSLFLKRKASRPKRMGAVAQKTVRYASVDDKPFLNQLAAYGHEKQMDLFGVCFLPFCTAS